MNILLACVDGGAICIPALIAAGVAVAGWLGFARAQSKDCEDHCDHCPGEHEE